MICPNQCMVWKYWRWVLTVIDFYLIKITYLTLTLPSIKVLNSLKIFSMLFRFSSSNDLWSLYGMTPFGHLFLREMRNNKFIADKLMKVPKYVLFIFQINALPFQFLFITKKQPQMILAQDHIIDSIISLVISVKISQIDWDSKSNSNDHHQNAWWQHCLPYWNLW